MNRYDAITAGHAREALEKVEADSISEMSERQMAERLGQLQTSLRGLLEVVEKDSGGN